MTKAEVQCTSSAEKSRVVKKQLLCCNLYKKLEHKRFGIKLKSLSTMINRVST